MNKEPKNLGRKDLALSLSQATQSITYEPDPRKKGDGIFWQLALVVLFFLPAGAASVAVKMLWRLPQQPHCESIYWPMASASLRLYCGELAADGQTLSGLLEAIALVKVLPLDHPLRSQIDKSIDQWATEILALGDRQFNTGQLSEAIATARQVPSYTTTYKLVKDRIRGWQTTWTSAEGIYREAEDLMRSSQWQQAIGVAIKLQDLDNTYWRTTKYAEINQLIQTTRTDSERLIRARELSETGGPENLLAAISLAANISQDSYLYAQAQTAVWEYGRQMMRLAETALEKGNSLEAIAIARKIPAETKLHDQTQDFVKIASAKSSAGEGNIASLEAAIMQAQKIDISRPMYGRAQQLIGRWQREIEDVSHLEKARQLAASGRVNDLAAAVAEVGMIPVSNPRYSEAQAIIKTWKREIEIIEDSPLLNRAQTLASKGNVGYFLAAIASAEMIDPGRALYQEAQSNIRQWWHQIEVIEDLPYLEKAEGLAIAATERSLKRAIAQARRIAPGRALYQEASEKIASWTDRIQRLEDRPYLDHAQNLAALGDLEAAITTAQQIRPGRALYDRASREIENWQNQLSLQSARQLALTFTPEALARAIAIADRVPKNSLLRSEADLDIANWSQELLQIARDMSRHDLPGAIAIAQKIPPSSNLYSAARSQIAEWQQILNPDAAEQLDPAVRD
ncbi:MAG: chromosome segregation ATPase [Hormoscilla sp. SP12CHS1]|nr:chromosome segregation ATPase [Hormoscilla sp. SP12CHS1]